MFTKNIFAGFGLRSEFVNLIYAELMKRDFVSYATILSLYYGRPKRYYDRIACSSETGYGELKKAFPEILPYCEQPDGIYGEVTLTIEPNRELCGKILAYGQYLEVMEPVTLGEQIKDIIKKQLEHYSD